MGLCKCPKKTVTTMFCYEHRVNVCEFCMVANHKSCVVQSYLNWLKDTDFDPNCSLCFEDLKNSECVRLLCYHLYHWDCLSKYFDSMPTTTAPAGYKCPVCSTGVFPNPHLVSPVAEELKKKLRLTDWGRKEISALAVSVTDSDAETGKPLSEIPMVSTAEKAFAVAKSANNFTVSRSQKAKNSHHSRKLYLPKLYTIVEDCHSNNYTRKRQNFTFWKSMHCRRGQIVEITATVIAVFILLSLACIFLLPDGTSEFYEDRYHGDYLSEM